MSQHWLQGLEGLLTIDGDVAQGSGAVVLYVRIG